MPPLDDDDDLGPNALRHQMEALPGNPEALLNPGFEDSEDEDSGTEEAEGATRRPQCARGCPGASSGRKIR